MSKIYTIICLLFVSIANIQAQGNVGIGTNTPDASAKLDISSTDKGLLIPRVSLTNASTFGLSGATSTAGMMVYNTNAAMTGGYGVGFYYWTGTWNKVATGNPIQAVLNNGQILIGDASNVPTANTMSGDATLSNAGVLDLSNGAVETSEIADGAVTTIKINDGAVTTAKINDVAVTTIKIADNNVDGTKINLTGNANGDLMYYNGTDWVRLASGTTGQILQTNAGAAPTWSNPNDLFVFENGLTETAPNIVRLGGTLTQATTITQGNYNMTYNLNGTGDFDIQDNGTSALFVKDDGNVGVNTNNPTEKLNVNGGVLIPNGASYWIGNNADLNQRLRMHLNGTTSYVDYATGNLNFRAGTATKVTFDSIGNVQVNNLAGTGNRTVFADQNGVLKISSTPAVSGFHVDLGYSPDDMNGTYLSSYTQHTTNADDVVYTLNMGFTISLDGTNYDRLYISTNGWIMFGNASTIAPASSQTNGSIPSSTFSEPTIFAFWDDLVVDNDGGDGNGLTSGFTGLAPGRVIHIDFENKTYTNSVDINFMVDIHESGMINVRYREVGGSEAQGIGATIGYQGKGGASANVFLIGYNARVLDDNRQSPHSWSIMPIK